MKKTFSKDYLKNELGLPHKNTLFSECVKTDNYAGKYRIIFQDKDGKTYETCFWCGEYENAWQEIEEVEVNEVELKEFVVQKWNLKGATQMVDSHSCLSCR